MLSFPVVLVMGVLQVKIRSGLVFVSQNQSCCLKQLEVTIHPQVLSRLLKAVANM